MKKTAIQKILKETRALKDRSFARQVRVSAIETIKKVAEEHGILQDFDKKPVEYKSREQLTANRGGEEGSPKLYGLSPEHPDIDNTTRYISRSLSTRYSPDRPGVMARRVSDGVIQDPITNKVYDWNEGFKTEDGDDFPGGRVDLQTDVDTQ
jgi:hypothetical protein